MTAPQATELKNKGYDPGSFYHANAELQEAVDGIASGRFSSGDSNLFRPLTDALLYQDPYMLFADYGSYIECQDQIDRIFSDRDGWSRMSILNTARMGGFSSDRAIREYCDEIWHANPVNVALADLSPETVSV
ncbi:MAG TPA: glycogen/starch/alpha-glucan phosphorylase [Bryobacteraceae bacterium]|nr:glycogen/starch/alpha-glucan phosphorylase [Bryobacteraceae bacterium]